MKTTVNMVQVSTQLMLLTSFNMSFEFIGRPFQLNLFIYEFN